MKKLVIFDLDGVLVDSKENHFNALNAALKEIDIKYVISKSEQKEKFEGLPTKKKLEILSAEKGLPVDLHKKIFISRKNYVRRHPQENIIEQYLISNGYESVCMEDLNPIEQINIIRSATDVVSFLGSSLVNLYFINQKINLLVISLDSDSDKNFNADMFKYYNSMIGEEKVNSKYINASEESEPIDFIIKEIEGFYGS